MKKLALAGVACGVFAASCTSTYTTENTYSASEVGVSKKVERCRVLEVREVQIRDKDVVEGAAGIGTATGALGAGLGGAQIGSGGAGTVAAAAGIGLLGGVLGQAVGRKVGEKAGTRTGVEYSVLLADGEERTSVQDLAEGDRIINPGETCRIQMAYDPKNATWTGPVRILPAEQLADEIARPKETRFSN